MTDGFWQQYKEKYLYDPRDAQNFWITTKNSIKPFKGPTRHIDLLVYYTSDNALLLNAKKSTKSPYATGAEAFCRDQAFDLQACLIQRKASEGSSK